MFYDIMIIPKMTNNSYYIKSRDNARLAEDHYRDDDMFTPYKLYMQYGEVGCGK